jgi:hypothetical protein
MPGSPKKRARAAAVASGELTPGQSAKRRESAPREPTGAETATVVQCLELAWTLESAWACIGISRDMGRAWMDRGKANPSGPFGDFAHRVALAREAGVQLLHSRVLEASTGYVRTETTVTIGPEGESLTKEKRSTERGDWRAAQWALERADPARFTTRVQERLELELRAVFDVLERELDADTCTRVVGELAKLGTSEA